MDIIPGIILGAVQGIVEWLPLSSEGVLVLIQNNFFSTSFTESVSIALWLHLGTVFSAIIYLWSDVKKISVETYKVVTKFEGNPDTFLVTYWLAVLVSFLVAGIVFFGFRHTFENVNIGSQVINIIIGLMLLVTSALFFYGNKSKQKEELKKVPTILDAILTGIGQGLAVIPGISRSGTTTAVLLIRQVSEEKALRFSFLIGIPIVLAGNILLQLTSFSISIASIIGLITSFVFGLISIHYLLKLARHISFGWLVGVFGLLTILSVFL